MRISFMVAVAFGLFAAMTPAHAACIAGAGESVIYKTSSGLQHCPDGENWVPVSVADAIPAGAVMAFNLSACPSGWSALPGAAGRVIVGTGSYGANTDADGANASVTYTLALTGGNRDLALTVAQMPSHTHGVAPPAATTSSAGSHTHTMANPRFTGSNSHAHGSVPGTVAEGPNPADGVASPISTNAAGAHTHTVDIAPFTSGSAGSGAAFDNRMPYIALLYCQKN